MFDKLFSHDFCLALYRPYKIQGRFVQHQPSDFTKSRGDLSSTNLRGAKSRGELLNVLFGFGARPYTNYSTLHSTARLFFTAIGPGLARCGPGLAVELDLPLEAPACTATPHFYCNLRCHPGPCHGRCFLSTALPLSTHLLVSWPHSVNWLCTTWACSKSLCLACIVPPACFVFLYSPFFFCLAIGLTVLAQFFDA